MIAATPEAGLYEVSPGWSVRIVEGSVLAGIGETHPERLKIISLAEAETRPFQDWHELPPPFLPSIALYWAWRVMTRKCAVVHMRQMAEAAPWPCDTIH